MKKFIFVCDLYKEEYIGGAELTTEAIIECAPSDFVIEKIKCESVSEDTIKQKKDYHWIIGNFSKLTKVQKMQIIKNVKYSIIEYDYKFCNYRSLEAHKIILNEECDCTSRDSAKINILFYGMAKKVWFMSEKQRDIFFKNVKTIKENKSEVLSSVFSKKNMNFFKTIRLPEKNNKYLIVKTSSWIKNYNECIEYAKNNKLDYEIVENLKHDELLKKLSYSKGLIFLPKGADTCPRLVIEAKLLGCDLILNSLVQHKDEQWFASKDSCLTYLEQQKKKFWQKI